MSRQSISGESLPNKINVQALGETLLELSLVSQNYEATRISEQRRERELSRAIPPVLDWPFSSHRISTLNTEEFQD